RPTTSKRPRPCAATSPSSTRDKSSSTSPWRACSRAAGTSASSRYTSTSSSTKRNKNMTPAHIWTAYYTIIYHEVVRVLRIWSQTLLPPVITSGLYFIVFGTFIGSQLPPIHGFSYIQFIVPGLIMMQVITSSYSNTVSTFYFAKWTKTLDEMLISPMPEWVIIAGFVSGGVMRGLIVGALVLATSLFFTHLVIFNAFILVAAIVVTSVL